MSTLTDTQLIILSAASQRDDRGAELPSNIKGKAARKVVDKLIRAGLLEEVLSPGLATCPPNCPEFIFSNDKGTAASNAALRFLVCYQSAQFAVGSTYFFNTRASRPIAINRMANQEFSSAAKRRCCP